MRTCRRRVKVNKICNFSSAANIKSHELIMHLFTGWEFVGCLMLKRKKENINLTSLRTQTHFL